MKPVIGLIPLVDSERDNLWMYPGYMEGIAAAGGIPLMLPLESDGGDLDQLCNMCDGILLTGGHDICPEVYGAKRLPECGACSPERDRMEEGMLARALAADKPVLGICRGLQFLNAALGGTLWQDLPSQRATGIGHRQEKPYDRFVHTVTILPDTPLAMAVGAGERGVNSLHHQAVCELAPSLRPMAMSEDGLVEALWRPENRFVWGVQWHPEYLWQTDSMAAKIFREFVAACI